MVTLDASILSAQSFKISLPADGSNSTRNHRTLHLSKCCNTHTITNFYPLYQFNS